MSNPLGSTPWLSTIHRSPVTHLFGSAVHLGVQVIQVMVIGHLLGAEVIGHYGYCLAVIAPTLLLATWHVRHARAVDGRGSYAWEAYARLRTIGLSVAVVALAMGSLIPGLAAVAWLYLALVVLKVGDAWMDLPYSAYQRTGEIGRIGIGVGTRGVLGIVVFIAVLLGHGPLPWAIVAQALASWCWWLVCERPGLRAVRLVGECDGAQRSALALLTHLWPLGLTVALGSLIAGFPRIALAERHSIEEAGHYLLLGYLFIPALLVQASLQQATIALLAAAVASGERGVLLRRLVRLAMRQLAVLGLVMVGVLVVQAVIGLSWIAQGFSVRMVEVSWFTAALGLAVLVNSCGLAMDALGAYCFKLIYWLALTGVSVALTWWWSESGIVGAGMAGVVSGALGVLLGGWWLAYQRLPRREGSHGII